jgi:glycosyltransferase involved in cell wall biosynthesis
MNIAIVHDWLTVYGGAERVLENMLAVLPEAHLFSLIDFVPEDRRGFLGGRRATTSFIQRLPFARSKYRQYLPLLPLAIEQLDLSAYDIVISSSHAVAKGVITGPDQLHICMCYSPVRYAWDLQHQYLAETGLDRGLKGCLLGPLARAILHYIRMWDVRTADGVDSFIAISHYIARRIRKVYRREATVIYPPVAVDAFPLRTDKEKFYFTASRLVPYKKVDLIVEAFAAMPDKELVVIGDGPEFRKIKAKATSNVQLLGYQSSDVLRDHMQRARAFIFAAEEDFGIVTLEAQACGTPVIAYGKGGSTETVRHGETGLWFGEQSVASLCQAVETFASGVHQFTPETLRSHAQKFAPARFRKEFSAFVGKEWASFQEANSFGEKTCPAKISNL